METKKLTIQVPKGYEFDSENSTSEYIKLKPIENEKREEKNITYEDVCNMLFDDDTGYFINQYGEVNFYTIGSSRFDANNASNGRQLTKLLALNKLINIAEYYNRLHAKTSNAYTIFYSSDNYIYYASITSTKYLRGISAIFNRREDAQAVIDNPNFREILDTIYK